MTSSPNASQTALTEEETKIKERLEGEPTMLRNVPISDPMRHSLPTNSPQPFPE